MSSTDYLSGPEGFLVIVVIALLVHEPWRWLGLYVGNALPADSPVFEIVRAMATALVAGLVMRLVLFPAGALADVSLAVRIGAVLAGLAIYIAAGRHLAAGVFGSAVVLAAGQIVFS